MNGLDGESLIGFAVAEAIRRNPAAVQAEHIRLLRREAELEAENQELRRRLGLAGRWKP